jgi:3-deoxy-D-manno-octulosonate 8-phosphate phosphatase (KDO 8-P phosphatase)
MNKKFNLTRVLKQIKILAMDVDGVLTAGELIITDSGKEIKVWNVKDRLGFAMLGRSGLDVKLVWITGRGCADVRARAKEVGVDDLYQKKMDKKRVLEQVCGKYGVDFSRVVYIGDDLADLGALRAAGLAVCPEDAPGEIKKECDYISHFPGGKGVLREVVEMLLKSRGIWEKIVELYDR